jgi:hypothetical protein
MPTHAHLTYWDGMYEYQSTDAYLTPTGCVGGGVSVCTGYEDSDTRILPFSLLLIDEVTGTPCRRLLFSRVAWPPVVEQSRP